MTDENGKRHIEMPSEQPSQAAGRASYVEAASEMGNAAIRGMAPAEKGWILAAVVVILGAMALLEITNYFTTTNTQEKQGVFLMEVEKNRSQENRRLQEQNRILAQALSRRTDRTSRQQVDESRAHDVETARKLE